MPFSRYERSVPETHTNERECACTASKSAVAGLRACSSAQHKVSNRVMKAVTLKAHFDGQKICLDEPFELRPDAKLLVVVNEDPSEEERDEWYALSHQSLARAYGDDEPDYSDVVEQRPRSE